MIVTGAGRGIGQATATRFAARAPTLMLIGRTRERWRRPPRCATGGAAVPHAPTCRGRETCARRSPRRWTAGTRIDVLVNNAGIDDETPFLEMAEERWHEVVGTNLTGAVPDVAAGRAGDGATPAAA